MQNNFKVWSSAIPTAPAPVFVASDPYADCERMTMTERSELVNSRFSRPSRQVNSRTNELQVQRHTRATYNFGGHKHDPAVKTDWKNVDKGAAALQKSAPKKSRWGKK